MTDFLIRRFVRDRENTASPTVRASYGKLSGCVGIVCNLFLFFAKLTVGLLSGSLSVTADAVNNLSDASSSVISLLGFKLASKPADEEHPYGHGRYEYLSALAVAVLIIFIGAELANSSVKRILHPETVDFGIPMAVILCLSIGVKLWMMFFNRKLGRLIRSGSLEATAADSRNDVISTAAVLLAALISTLTRFDLDGYMGLCVAVFIIVSGFGLLKDTVTPMLGTVPDEETVEDLHRRIRSYPGVLGMHDLMVHDYGPGRQFASVHVEMAAEAPVLESHDLIDNIERDIRAETGIHLVIHYDPIVTSDDATGELRHFIDGVVQEIDSRLSIHDLRIVPGPTHTNVVFDCVIPNGVGLPDSEIRRRVSLAVREAYPEHICVITVDRSFVSAK